MNGQWLKLRPKDSARLLELQGPIRATPLSASASGRDLPAPSSCDLLPRRASRAGHIRHGRRDAFERMPAERLQIEVGRTRDLPVACLVGFRLPPGTTMG
jgi:hypothetical protein